MDYNVEIVLSVYKSTVEELKRSITSVLDQTHSSFLFTIAFDGPNIILKNYITEHFTDKRISIIQNATNNGLTYVLEQTVKNSSSKYLARIDAGDVWAQNKLELQFEHLEKHTEVIICGTQCAYLDKKDGEMVTIAKSNFGTDMKSIRNAINKKQGIFEHSSILFRRQINYRKRFLYAQDLDLYLRAMKIGDLNCLDEVLTYCLVKNDGLTINKKPDQLFFINLAYQDYHKNYLDDQVANFRTTKLSRSAWLIAKPFYIRFVKTNKVSLSDYIIKYINLFVCCLVFPPLFGYYIRRLWLSLN